MSRRASVIICTYNRAGILPGLFDAFAHQTIPFDEYELIVINDGSTDASDEVIRRYSSFFPNMTYILNETNQGLAASANRGIEVASTEKLVFTDDDCVPDPDWVENMASALSQAPIVCGQILTESHPYLTLARNIAEYHPVLMRNNQGFLTTIAGANMGFKKRVFTDIGNFLNECITPDMELLLRARSAGYTVRFEPGCSITHYPLKKSFIQTWKYEASRSFFTIQLRKKYKKLLRTPMVLESTFLLYTLSPALAFIKTVQLFVTNPRLFGYLHTFPVVFLLKMAWCFGAARGLMEQRKRGSEDDFFQGKRS